MQVPNEVRGQLRNQNLFAWPKRFEKSLSKILKTQNSENLYYVNISTVYAISYIEVFIVLTYIASDDHKIFPCKDIYCLLLVCKARHFGVF